MIELFYPVKNPINQTNLFGANATYYQKTLGTNGHPGIDFECPLYTPLYAPCDGDAFYAYDKYHGDGLYIRIPSNFNPIASIILWHMPDKSDTAHWILPTGYGVVSKVKAGQLIGYTGNSGFPLESNGPHLHVGYIPCNANGLPSNPQNGFNGCEDPMPLFNGKYAQDIETVNLITSEGELIANEISSAPISNQDKSWLFGYLQQVFIAFLKWIQNP